MSDDELERLLRLYLDLAEHTEGSPAAVQHSDAYDKVSAIIEGDVGTAVRLVGAALRMELSHEDEGYFGASVLEDLIGAHGPAVIAQLLTWAATSERIRRMLDVAYHYHFDPAVSRRINEVLVQYGMTPWTGSVGGEQPLRPPKGPTPNVR